MDSKLRFIIAKGYKANSAKGKNTQNEVKRKQKHISKSPLPAEAQNRLNFSATSCGYTCTICILCVSSEESSLETRCATVLLETDHIHTFCQAFAKILEFQKKRTCSA